jgi:hypothetical protein
VEIGSVVGILWKVGKDIQQWFQTPALHIRPWDPALNLRIWDLRNAAGVHMRDQKVVTLEVECLGRGPARECVATATFTKLPPGVLPTEPRFALHWADIPYSGKSTGAEPKDIGSAFQRLDVAFTYKTQTVVGCWVGVSHAFNHPDLDQAYLPPGNYELAVRIESSNSEPASIRLRLRSPKVWDAISATVIS